MSSSSAVDVVSKEIEQSLKSVREGISSAAAHFQNRKEPTLVAVSKNKPSFAIQAAYNAGQRHFGENYIVELEMKSQELESLQDIKWHFIGHVQSNKCKQLAGVRNLYMVETVDSTKVASKLDDYWQNSEPLKVLVQVNTSNEDSKSGIDHKEVLDLVGYIIQECPHLKFSGLMTIGNPFPDPDELDFKLLVEVKQKVCERYGLLGDDVELSMGMSSDYKIAIEMGSTNVRVGSLIFGDRDYSQKVK